MPNFRRYVSNLYHFTDRSNLPSIVEAGGLLSWKELNDREICVPVPGGNEWSHDADGRFGVDDFVHLCFKNEHPMEWSARKDGRLLDAVFLKIKPSIIQLPGVLFTDDVANKSGVRTLSREEANEIFDFEVLYTATNWNDPAIKERLKQVKKYEVLVPNFVPIEYITNLRSFGF